MRWALNKIWLISGFLIGSAVVAEAQNLNPPINNSIGSINNNSGIVTQGQIGGTNLIVNRPPPRSIDDSIRQFIRSNFKDKTKEIVPMVLVGDDDRERTNLCVEIESFLKSEGYKVGQRTYFLEPGAPQGVVFDPYTDPKVIMMKVGVNDRK